MALTFIFKAQSGEVNPSVNTQNRHLSLELLMCASLFGHFDSISDTRHSRKIHLFGIFGNYKD